MDEDKYPGQSGRRRFVKGVVGASALAGAGAGASGALTAATDQGGGTGGPTDFIGIENTDGPAPRGMPIVPLTTDEKGYLKGIWPDVVEKERPDGSMVRVTEQEMGDVTYSGRWFQYCGIQTAEGLEPTVDQDNYLRSSRGSYEWQAELEPNERLHVDHFGDYERWHNGVGTPGLGKPAEATWRSVAEGDEDVTEIPVQVIRSPKVPDLVAESDHGGFLEEATEDGFIAWLNKCTHFCCSPGFKSEGGARFDAADEVYCQCHQSVYDPFSPVELSFVAFPRTD